MRAGLQPLARLRVTYALGFAAAACASGGMQRGRMIVMVKVLALDRSTSARCDARSIRDRGGETRKGE